MEPVDEHFVRCVAATEIPEAGAPDTLPAGVAAQLDRLFQAQAQSRHLDFAARRLQARGDGFYTIGSAGHESNAAVGLLTEVTDPALLHYRSGGFYAARAALDGTTDPVRDILRSLTSSARDPISGGRHKVFGHAALNVIPQTSTIASHLPRAVGLAFAIGLARHLGRRTPWPETALVVCSLGDASVNHSTAAGALNAAAYLRHRGRPCPLLFVCEDNAIGISTRSPRGWTEAALRARPGLPYSSADGHEPLQLLQTTARAVRAVRKSRAPAVLHLKTVRLMGHAGSDVEIAYRSRAAIEGDYERDPLLATARALIRHGGCTPDEVLARYEATRERVAAAAEEVVQEPRLGDRAAVMAPLAYPKDGRPGRPRVNQDPESAGPGGRLSAPVTLAQAINHTLADAMSDHADVLVFGQDVAVKGGVYGVTRGLHKRFGTARVFDTLLDEQTILGTALGASLAGFLPVPEIQYLAYLHNAEDQLRGEAASLRFFSDGQYQNGMVVRVAGLAYQRGFGGHFHNDNSVAVLRDIPGIVLAVPSHAADAPALLRSCLGLARHDGRVCVFLEPIARYHTRDLFEGDGLWTADYARCSDVDLGQTETHGDGRDVLIVTFGNGVHMSRRASVALADEGIAGSVLDLRWLAPLPIQAVVDAAASASAVLVADETRTSGGVAESVVAGLVENGCDLPIARVTSADSFIPLGPAAETVLLTEGDVVAAARRLVNT